MVYLMTLSVLKKIFTMNCKIVSI